MGDRLRWSAPAELEAAAARVLPEEVYAFVACGADDERALDRNSRAFESRALLPRVLAHAADPDTSTTLLGSRLRAPVLVAPMGMQRMIHPDGESATAQAARAAGVGFTLATGSSLPLEAAADVAGDARWFQLYLMRDRAVSRDLVLRAVAAGYRAIVLTVDVPVVGHRPRDRRTSFQPQPSVHNTNFEPYASVDAGHHAYVADFEPDLGWDDLEWLVGVAGGTPVLVKGVLRADDARRATAAGAAGVVVSNHGGRQLGRPPATLDVLPDIVSAVPAGMPVLLDGGIRRAADIAIALASGAGAVLVGRPVLWALAAGGAAAVTGLLDDLVGELRRTMTLLGARSNGELTADLVATAGETR